VAHPPWGRGWHDLGDLRLDTGPLLVAGRFVDDSGGDLDRVEFELQRWSATTGDWRTLPIRAVRCTNGCFEVRGPLPNARCRLVLLAGFHRERPAFEFEAGARDLVIPVVAGHCVTMRCLLAPELDPAHLVFALQPRSGSGAAAAAVGGGTGWMPWNRHRGAGGWTDGLTTMRWSSVPGGRYDLVVRSPGFAEPFANLPDIVVPGPPEGDVRLARWDLRSAIAPIRVAARTGGEELGDSVFVIPVPQPLSGPWAGYVALGGVTIAAPPRPVDLLVAACGYRLLRVHAAIGRVDAELESLQVELAFAGVPELPDGIQLEASAHDPDPILDQRIAFDADVDDVKPLRALLGLASEPATIAGGRACIIASGAPQRVEVAVRLGDHRRPVSVTPSVISPAAGPITLQLVEAEILAAVAALRGR
jgi:hypothetical protein